MEFHSLVSLRREIHAEPEIGLDLPRTQEKVLAALEGLPVDISIGKDLSSVIAVLRGGPGPVVLLRADMDALPVMEQGSESFASRNSGVMHACGHDLHTAMLVGAARRLASGEVPGTVVFMFQPGEEGHGGAKLMLAEGLLDVAGKRPVAAYALHVFASLLPRGQVATRGGTIMSASDRLAVTVRGAGGHGSMPHHARDPVPAACEMVTALQTFVTRSFDVFDPVIVSVGTFHAGTASNIIPAEAHFEATVRTFSASARERMRTGASLLMERMAEAYGLEAFVEFRTGNPVAVNDPGEAAVVAETAGPGRFRELGVPFPGSEDFAFVLGQVPGALVALGACPPGRDPATAPANHAPEAAYDESILLDGAALYASLAVNRMDGSRHQASAEGQTP